MNEEAIRCTFFNKYGHKQEGCFESIDQLQWWPDKMKRKGKTRPTKTEIKPNVAQVGLNSSPTPCLTSEQYARLVTQLFTDYSTSETPVNMDDKTKQNNDWVVDSGSTENIVINLDFLQEWTKHSHDNVTIPNGEKVTTEGAGTTTVTKDIKLEKIIYIPSFKTNLLYGSQLIKGLICVGILS